MIDRLRENYFPSDTDTLVSRQNVDNSVAKASGPKEHIVRIVENIGKIIRVEVLKKPKRTDLYPF